MEVLVGPSFSIEVSSCVGDCTGVTPPHPQPPSPRDTNDFENQKCVPREEEFSDEISSSIGDPDDDAEDDEGDGDGEVVESKLSRGLGSLGSLEDSLPIKRGLSSHFTGKSKSFANLSELSSVKDLEKPENPFNKRRRVLIASKWRRSSFYIWSNPKSMPLLAQLDEDDNEAASSIEDKEPDEVEEEEEEEDGKNHDERGIAKFHKRGSRLNSFKSRSCFCLSDLQEIDEQ